MSASLDNTLVVSFESCTGFNFWVTQKSRIAKLCFSVQCKKMGTGAFIVLF